MADRITQVRADLEDRKAELELELAKLRAHLDEVKAELEQLDLYDQFRRTHSPI